MDITLGDKLQMTRKRLGYTQKEFAEFVGVPQPSLSAYENNKNCPTTEVMITIAKKCNISLDWLCGLSVDEDNKFQINEVKDLANILYKLKEINEIDIQISLNKPDIETSDDKWCATLAVYGNDKKHKHNMSLCQIIESVNNLNLDVESYEIDAETYEFKKDRDLTYYKNHPLTKRVIPELTREERNKKRVEWLENKYKYGG